MEEFAKIFRQIEDLLQELRIPKFLDEWKSIQSMQSNPQFSVAVVGEFSRGKSTLLNRILGQDFLPVGDLPTTAMITYIRYGSKVTVTRIFQDGHQEELSLDDVKKTIASDAGQDPTGKLYIEVPDVWLQTNKVEFLDTPGAGDLEEKRGELTQHAIAECDATLIVISATMPLSLTEKSFVEEHIFQRKIPCVACVLTRLDQIKESERENLVKFIAQKIKTWSPHIELWSSHASPVLSEKSEIKVAGQEQILQAIAKWTMEPEHEKLRKQQIVAQTQFLMKKVYHNLLGKRTKLIAEKEGTEESARSEFEKQQSSIEIVWKDIALEMEQRELDAEKWLKERFQEMSNDLATELSAMLHKFSHKPEEWAEKEFPVRLKRALKKMMPDLEKYLQATIQNDIQWLKKEISSKFSQTISSDKPKAILQSENLQNGIKTEKEDGFRLQQIGVVAATGLATSMAFPILGTVLIPATIVGGAIASYQVIQKQNKKFEKIEYEIRKIVEEMTAKMFEKSKIRLREYYKKTIDNVKKGEIECLEIEHDAISAHYTYDAKDIQLTQRQETTAMGILNILQDYQKILGDRSEERETKE